MLVDWPNAIPQDAREPQRNAKFNDAEDDVENVSTLQRHFLFPKFAKDFREQEANGNEEHHGLWNKP